ncbi:unnamed protein product [Clavelina lepadiformis]|uniref:Methionine--tRNA ligase, mitochondrial n=2 Tax=Clavelina lepadiformis TaxID=159417 RepID=A0ABP0FVF6_CLALP
MLRFVPNAIMKSCWRHAKYFRLGKLQQLLRNKLPCTLILTSRSKSYYITTPIFYVNSVPHIGHLYTATIADAACRWQKLKYPVNTSQPKLVSGTDEHGTKVMQAAVAKQENPKRYCDDLAQKFKDMMKLFDVQYHDFIRTTDERHKVAVENFWNTIHANGYIYKGNYEGWYSTSDETFVNDLDVEQVIDRDSGEACHIFKDTGRMVEWTKETNYMFKLSELVEQVKAWVHENPNSIYPPKMRKLVLDTLDRPVGDLSVSRERTRVPWGIQVPNDPSQTIYVWMDALVNYLTAAGYPEVDNDIFKDMWPADCHIVGMDIVKFHAIYWPAFLIAAGLELPKQIVVHSHWTVNNFKMSKSVGNVVDPFDMAKKVTPMGLRYFLLRQGVIEYNCDYKEEMVYAVLNADLANDLGNCLNRAVAKHLNPEQVYPPFHQEIFSSNPNYVSSFVASKKEFEFIDLVRNLPGIANNHALEFHFYNAIGEIMNVVRKANVIIHRNQLWTLDKSVPDQLRFLQTLLHCVYEGLRVSGILLQPFIPELAEMLLNKLSIPRQKRNMVDADRSFLEHDGKVEPLVGNPLAFDKKVLYKRL